MPKKQFTDTLTELSDEAFVQRAYLELLGRPADPTGFRDYLWRLRGGESRRQLWEEMAGCDEAQAFAQGGQRPVYRATSYTPGPAPAMAPAAPGGPLPQVGSVQDLLATHGTTFVRQAYGVVLGREPDPEGLARYLAVLKSGMSRSYVLSELVKSSEAQRRGVQLAGLDKLLDGYRRAQKRDWSGWYWRVVKGAESDLPPARELRVLLLAKEHA